MAMRSVSVNSALLAGTVMSRNCTEPPELPVITTTGRPVLVTVTT